MDRSIARRARAEWAKTACSEWAGPPSTAARVEAPIEQWIFADEVQRTGFPLPFLTLSTVGPTIRHYATDEQKDAFLPEVLKGKMLFAIGYSEPDAGTDLASLKTRAVRDGDEWVITGQKMWTSLADFADYIWLAARTDPDAPKHRGISMFLVPTSGAGLQDLEDHDGGRGPNERHLLRRRARPGLAT